MRERTVPPQDGERSRAQSQSSTQKEDIDLEKGRERAESSNSARPPPLYTPKPASAKLPPRKPPQIVIIVNDSKEGRDALGSKKGSHLLKIGFICTILALALPIFFLVMEKNALRNDMHWWGAFFAESYIFFPAMASCFIPAYMWAASWVHPEELEQGNSRAKVFWNHLVHWKNTKGGDFTTKSMQLLLSYAAIFGLWNHFSKVDGLITMGTRRIARKERNKNSYKLLQRIDRSAVKIANTMEDKGKDDQIARLEALLKERFPIVTQTVYVPTSTSTAPAPTASAAPPAKAKKAHKDDKSKVKQKKAAPKPADKPNSKGDVKKAVHKDAKTDVKKSSNKSSDKKPAEKDSKKQKDAEKGKKDKE